MCQNGLSFCGFVVVKTGYQREAQGQGNGGGFSVLCNQQEESHDHLFVGCNFFSATWFHFVRKNQVYRDATTWNVELAQ